MKILLINNNTAHLKALNKALVGHDVEIQEYAPGLDFYHRDKDLVILSGGGGEGLEIDDTDYQGRLWYEDEMKFVRSCQKPLIGICMGFEIMAKAYDKPVPYLGKTISKTSSLDVTEKGWQLFGKQSFRQVESHGWSVSEAPEGFETLAKSEHGVELMYDPLLRQIGSQFHPELGGTLRLEHLLSAVINP